MKKLKLLALSSILMMVSTVQASSVSIVEKKRDCFKQNILSTSGYSFDKKSDKEITMCINSSSEHDNYTISEKSFVYGDNEYKISGLSSSDLSNIESISNLNGKLVIKTKSKKIYTGDIGYVLSNKGYLPLKNNNEINLIKEEISNVDKVIYSGELIVFTQDKKVFMKVENKWEQLPLKDVVDVTQSRFGSYFIITKSGVFAKMQESDNRTPDPTERGIFYRFDRANIATIPVSSLRFRFVENHPLGNFRLVMDNKKNKHETFYVYFSVNKAQIEKGGKVNEPKSPVLKPALKRNVIESANVITNASDVFIEDAPTNIFGDFKMTYLNTNHISTKYNETVKLKYKERISLLDHPIDKNKTNNFSNIVKVIDNLETYTVYILRDNGLLQIFSKENNTLIKTIEGVKKIEQERDSVHIELD